METNPDEWSDISVWEQPWMAEDDALVTLCKDCHEEEGRDIKDVMGRIDRYLRERLSSYELESVFDLLFSVKKDPAEWGKEYRDLNQRRKNAER